MKHRVFQVLPAALVITATAALAQGDDGFQDHSLRQIYDQSRFFTQDIAFPQDITTGNIAQGRGIFGLGAGPVIDPTLSAASSRVRRSSTGRSSPMGQCAHRVTGGSQAPCFPSLPSPRMFRPAMRC